MLQTQKGRTGGAKIWIDLNNTPHIPFFIPIIRELKRRGHVIVLTARDAFQVCELADKMNLQYKKIGRHSGKNIVRKVFGLFWRTVQLTPFYLRHRPGLALAHGSRSQFLLGNLVRIPTVVLMDYEGGRSYGLFRSRWGIIPEVWFRRLKNPDRRRFYQGIKEDVYVPEFVPDPSLLEDLGLKQDEIIVTVRPPANEAHYHNNEGDKLLEEFMMRICQNSGIRVVLLPRNRRQEKALRKNYPEWFDGDRTVIPTEAVDGINLIWFSDLIVCGGGTMNREAAALGVPAYSIFRGQTGVVDQMLEKEGRLTFIRNHDDIWNKIRLVPRNKNKPPDNKPRPALEDIVNNIEEIIRIENVPRCCQASNDSN